MRTLIITLALTVGSYAGIVQGQDPQKLPPKATVDTLSYLKVQNNRKVPVIVYLESGRFPLRLGTVSSRTTQTLLFPRSTFEGRQDVRFFVHPEGEAADLSTQRFALSRAAQMSLVIPAFGDMAGSSVDTMSQVLSPSELSETTVTVENSRSVPVTVFAKRLTIVTRLGVVAPGKRETLRFPSSVVAGNNTITLFVHPEGGRDLASETFKVKGGEHIGLRVPKK